MEKVFDIQKNDVITITGAGGKTSLLFYLAKRLSILGKVLVTTTTKIYVPELELFERLIVEDKVIIGKNKGIDVVGEKIENGKIHALTYEKIDSLRKKYDYILIEGDGAKEKLLKEWNETEPCIPNFSTINIGVINMEVFKLSLSQKNIHRFEIFSKKFPNYIEDMVSSEFLAEYIKKAKYFYNSQGKNYIFFNGIDGETELEKFNFAIQTANLLKKEGYTNKIVMGSLRKEELFEFCTVDAVVMASGFSKRMGQNKLKMPYRDTSLLEYTLEKLSYLPFYNIIVCGREEWVKKVALDYGYIYVENTLAERGQSESVKLGVLNSQGEGIVFFTGDQPFLSENTILKLYYNFEKYRYITIPISQGERFSPVFFPENKKIELLELKGDTGGRDVIRNTSLISLVEFPLQREFYDIDTPEDYIELLKFD